MANEVKVSAKLAYNDGVLQPGELELPETQFTVASDPKRYYGWVQVVTDTYAALQINGLTPGFTILLNRDATNDILIRTVTNQETVGRISPGSCCLIELGSANLEFGAAAAVSIVMEGFTISQ